MTTLFPPKLFSQYADTPKCSNAHLFLHDALSLAGAAMFGEVWTGEELLALDWPDSPQSLWLATRAKGLTQAPRIIPLPAAKIGRGMSRAIQAEPKQLDSHVWEWRDAERRARAMKQWEENRDRIARARKAADWLHDKFREGAISTVSRLVGTPGEPQPMQASDWYCENIFEKRFLSGRYERWTAYASKALPAYIFVDRTQLERQAATLGHADAIIAGADLSACSPYLRFAVGFSIKHGQALSEWPRPAVVAQLNQEWNEANPGDPMSATMAERMSYVVRVHDPEAISAGSTAKGGRKNG